MKLMKMLAVALLFIGLSACGGSASFNPEKCKQLEEKARSGEALTESDYDEMIDQMGAAIEVLSKKQKELNGDEEKTREYSKSEEAQQLVGAVIGFGLYLDSHEKDLSESNIKKLAELEKRFKELDD